MVSNIFKYHILSWINIMVYHPIFSPQLSSHLRLGAPDRLGQQPWLCATGDHHRLHRRRHAAGSVGTGTAVRRIAGELQESRPCDGVQSLWNHYEHHNIYIYYIYI